MQNKNVSIWIKSTWVLIFTLIFVSCQSSDQVSVSMSITEPNITLPTATGTQTASPSPTPTATNPPTLTVTDVPPTKTPRPTNTPIPLPEGEEALRLKTTDGLTLAGYLYTPEKPVAESIVVLLAHEYYSSHKSWEAFAMQVVEAGFTASAFDFRGHGDSQGNRDFSGVETDINAAMNELIGRGFDQIICMGGSMGGTGCMAAAVHFEQLVGLANLSGPMSLGAGQVVTRQDIENMAIPKIFMVAEGDTGGPEFVNDFIEIAEVAAEPKEIYIYPGVAHASGLLFDESGDEVQEILLNFIKGFSQPTREQPAVAVDCIDAGLPEIACTGVSTNDEWVPVIREFGGIPMALVPAGCYTMGSTDEQIELYLTMLNRRGLYDDEQPAHRQCFHEPFWIDVYEVTNGFYGSYGWWHDNDQPRESVTWFEAESYCRERGVRLPTEVEWEYAARGPDNLLYPWGNTFDGNRLNFCDSNCQNPGADTSYDDGYSTTAPVGSYPDGVSWVGALDMAGNVWEWVSSILLPYPYEPDDGREVNVEQDGLSLRMVRGGGRLDPDYVVRSANRNERMPTDFSGLYGLRCARSFVPEIDGEVTSQSRPALVEAPPLEAQLGDTWNRPQDGAVMVFVPGGTFQMGAGTAGHAGASWAEFPEHPVKVDSFWIDKYELNNKQYAEFLNLYGNLKGGGVTWLELESEFCLIEKHGNMFWPKVGYADHPVIDISWYGAQAYCDWVGGRLPTEAEWEYAASGPNNWIYPWGNEYDCTRGNFHDWIDEDDPPIFPDPGERGCDGIDFTSPVDAFPQGASWVGALDMAGNVWDWVADWGVSFYPSNLQVNPTGPKTGTEKIVRGGSWNNHHPGNRTTMRGDYRPINRSYYVGFRCAYPAVP